MPNQLYENANNSYTISVRPLTATDQLVIKKAIKPHYQILWILLPLWVMAFFFGWWYFIPCLALLVLYIISAVSTTQKYERSLAYPKIILTGKITRKEPPGDGTFVYLGQEVFELSYVKINCSIEPGDTIVLHYSQYDNGKRGILLSVEKEDQHIPA